MKIFKSKIILYTCFIYTIILIPLILISTIFPYVIILDLLIMFLIYDYYKRYRCYLILTKDYISMNHGIVHGFTTVYFKNIKHITFTKNALIIFTKQSEKVHFNISVLNSYDKEYIINFLNNHLN